MSKKSSDISVLFVCLGNICRSPLGEGICRDKLGHRSLESVITVDSCGTGAWHIGKPPHIESQKIAKRNGIDISAQRARQLEEGDSGLFSHFIAMDQSNKSDMEAVLRDGVRIHCLREFDPEQSSLDVPDPYFGGPEGFVEVFDIIDRSVERLLDSICEEHSL